MLPKEVRRTKIGTVGCVVCTQCGYVERNVEAVSEVLFGSLDAFSRVSPKAESQGAAAKNADPLGGADVSNPRRRFSMKDGLCLKCGSGSVGHLAFLPDTGEGEAESDWQAVGTLADGSRVGALEAYVCTKCGYLETYVKKPDQVPFEKLTGFKWVNTSPDGAGPYR